MDYKFNNKKQSKSIPTGWLIFQFNEFLKLKYGKELPKIVRKHDGSIPIYGSSGIMGMHNTPLVNEPCLIIGRKGNAGKIFYVDKSCWPIDTTYFLDYYPMYDLKFLYFLLTHMELNHLDSSTTTLPSLRRNDVDQLLMVLPPHTEQKRIVAKIESIFAQIDGKQKELEIFSIQITSISESFNALRSSILDNIFKKIVNNNCPIKTLSKQIDTYEKYNPKINTRKEFKYIEIGCVGSDKKIKSFKIINAKNAPSRARNIIRKNDVIYGTTRPYYRNVVLISKNFDNQICSTGFCVLRSKTSQLEPSYLFYYMLSDMANVQIISTMRGSNYPAVSNKNVTSITIPLPSLSEQKRTVAKIESIFDKIDVKQIQMKMLEKQLKIIPDSMNMIKNSILKQAFEGRLVHQDPNDEHASILLEKIRQKSSIND